MLKLSYNLEYLGAKNAIQALAYVDQFEKTQSKRIKNGLVVKRKNMLLLACRDARDVLQGMKRWDGCGEENWNCFGNEWTVQFGRN